MDRKLDALIKESQEEVLSALERGETDEEILRLAERRHAMLDAYWDQREAERARWRPLLSYLYTAGVMIGLVAVALIAALLLTPLATAIFGQGLIVGVLTYVFCYLVVGVATIIVLMRA